MLQHPLEHCIQKICSIFKSPTEASTYLTFGHIDLKLKKWNHVFFVFFFTFKYLVITRLSCCYRAEH